MQIRMQEDIKDCGIYALQALYKFYTKQWLDINELKYLAKYNENGISITNLIELGKKINIEIVAFKINFEELKNLKINNPYLTIINIDNFLHYVIIKKIDNQYIELYDSVNGKRRLNLEVFKEMFINIILETSFKKKEIINSNLVEKTRLPFPVKFSYVLFFIICSLVVVLLNYTLSLVNKNIFFYIQNKVWSNANKNIFLLLWISITLILITYFDSLISIYLKTKISKEINKNFINKIKDADYLQISKIEQNEILLRYLSINLVASYYVSFFSFFPSFIFYLTLSIPLFYYINFQYTIIIFLLNILKIIISYFINLKIASISKKLITSNLNEVNDLTFFSKNNDSYNKSFWNEIKSLDFIEIIELNKNYENKLNNLSSIKNLIFSMLTIATNTLIFIVFINYKNNNISELFFVFQIQNLLNEPINNLQNFVMNKKVNKINIERLNFILNIPTYPNKNKGIYLDKLSKIKIKNLSFSYTSKPLLSNINLDIKNNLIIKGKNGSGKTTMLKALNGYFSQIKNSIFFEGIAIEKISRKWIINNVYFLDKNNNFPNCDLYTYLFFDIKQEEREKLLTNKTFLSLLKILKIDLFSNLFLLKDKLSMGQIQIIKLMPLIIKKYQLILLDEALEFLSNSAIKSLKFLILEKQKDSIFIETSHTNRFITKNHSIFNLV